MFWFGVIQIVMSQIPDFHSMMWVSIVAAIMSFCYASIGFGLGVAKVIGTYVLNSSNHIVKYNVNSFVINKFLQKCNCREW